MGGCNSMCIPHKNPNKVTENHVKIKSHKRNLSATFNWNIDKNDNVEQLNVNMATEEELMTLPGINRATAHNIVEYRKQIGGFRKVEDLALVSGVGATKLNVIRLEVCVGSKKTSKTSSPIGSKHDLSTVYEKTPNEAKMGKSSTSSKMNINTANVFQLMRVHGINQTTAENIVAYRDRKGPFRTLDQLGRVKGIGPIILGAIRHTLTVDGYSPTSSVNGSVTKNGSNSDIKNCSLSGAGDSKYSSEQQKDGTPSGASKSDSSSPVHNNNITTNVVLTNGEEGGSVWDVSKLIGPMTEKSIRPSVEPFEFERNNRPALRIATWSAERCCSNKISNPGVREVICMTILENGLSIIAFQDLADSQALNKICEELNTPLIPHVKKWTGHRGQWRYLMSHNSGQDEEYLGFIYDASQEIEVVRSSLVQTGNSATCPFMVHFKVKQHPLVSVNVHNPCSTDQTRLHSEIMSTLPSILETLEQKSPGTKDVIILGNFNLGPGAKEFSLLKDNGYVHTVADGCFTDISLENMAGAATCDNIWLSKQAQAGYTGHSKVVREGLTSVWIPNGWAWGGLATDHCPVWAEFYTDSSVGLEDVDLIER